jgi:nitroreductase
MNFLSLVNNRQSTRKFSDKPIEKEKIDRCMEAFRLAPSACNSQPWTAIAVTEKEKVNAVAKATYSTALAFNKFVNKATFILVIVIEKPKVITQIGGRIKDKDYPLIDIGIAAEHFCLQAEEDGIGTCMLGWFQEKKIKKLLDIPKNKTIGLLIATGYPIEGYKQRKKIRKSSSEIVKYNSYN